MKTTAGEKIALRKTLSLNSRKFNQLLRLWESSNRIVVDSRLCNSSSLFFARRGLEYDGHDFIPEAIKQKKVIGVLADESYPQQSLSLERKIIRIPKLSSLAGRLATIFYHHPSEKLRVVGITGTDGKTTSSQLLAEAYESWGYPSASIGTMGIQLTNQYANSKSIIPYANQPNTTPDPIILQELFYFLNKKKITTVIMEVSSHGISMNRVSEVSFDSMLWTNLSPEHLDYHHTLEEYAFVKAKAFSLLKNSVKKNKLSVIGLDSFFTLYDTPHQTWIKQLINKLNHDLEYQINWFVHSDNYKKAKEKSVFIDLLGLFKEGTITSYSQNCQYHQQSQRHLRQRSKKSSLSRLINQVNISSPRDVETIWNSKKEKSFSNLNDFSFEIDLIGYFNAQNLTAAFLELQHFRNHCNQSLDKVNKDKRTTLTQLKKTWKHVSVKGRLEIFPLSAYKKNPNYASLSKGMIFIDYAHTPQALEKVLIALLPIKNQIPKSKLIGLFGAGGDRDKSKRFAMGEIGCRLADICIITDDNPRSENPETIREEIMNGWQSCYDKLSRKDKNNRRMEMVAGRREAIVKAIAFMNRYEGSIVLLAGKGHENYQIIDKIKYHFDEREVLDELLK